MTHWPVELVPSGTSLEKQSLKLSLQSHDLDSALRNTESGKQSINCGEINGLEESSPVSLAIVLIN